MHRIFQLLGSLSFKNFLLQFSCSQRNNSLDEVTISGEQAQTKRRLSRRRLLKILQRPFCSRPWCRPSCGREAGSGSSPSSAPSSGSTSTPGQRGSTSSAASCSRAPSHASTSHTGNSGSLWQSRASFEGSRRFHNHREGPYYGLPLVESAYLSLLRH